MVKTAMKRSGYWMFLQEVVKPRLGRSCSMDELKQRGDTEWNNLSNYERIKWKNRAKQFNESAAGRAELQFRSQMKRESRHQSASPQSAMRPMPKARTKLKESSNLLASQRAEEVDEYVKVYFEPGCNEFVWKRDHDVKNLLGQFTWRLNNRQQRYNDGSEFSEKEKYFLRRCHCIASVNVYYCDSSHTVYPSEISLIKFSIADGFIDQRNFILSLPREVVTPRDFENAIVNNEERTMLRVDGRGYALGDHMRSDLHQIWQEIKEFTRIADDQEKILVNSSEWNNVVGAFHTLHKFVKENAFSRIETRFVSIEDYLQAMITCIQQHPPAPPPQRPDRSPIAAQFRQLPANSNALTASQRHCSFTTSRNDQHELHVLIAEGMRQKWTGSEQFDMVTCAFHHQFLLANQCRTRACAMFSAHQTIFNFFTLSQQYAFPNFTFTGAHFPNRADLPESTDDDADCCAVNNGAECGIRSKMTSPPSAGCRETLRSGPRAAKKFEGLENSSDLSSTRQQPFFRQKEQREESRRHQTVQEHERVNNCVQNRREKTRVEGQSAKFRSLFDDDEYYRSHSGDRVPDRETNGGTSVPRETPRNGIKSTKTIERRVGEEGLDLIQFNETVFTKNHNASGADNKRKQQGTNSTAYCSDESAQKDICSRLERTKLYEGTRDLRGWTKKGNSTGKAEGKTLNGKETSKIGCSQSASRSPDNYVPEANTLTYRNTWWKGDCSLRGSWRWEKQKGGELKVSSVLPCDEGKKMQEKMSDDDFSFGPF